MYVITAHQRYRQRDRQTDGRTDVKRSHDRYIAKACSGNKPDALEYGTFAAVSLRIWQTGQQNL